MKMDITKAFDTLSWNVLLKVLKMFFFSEFFCKWINVILSSTNLSMEINGTHISYFNCIRGVRQGDLLSCHMFCLVEELLSRYITKLFLDGNLKFIKGSRSTKFSSHVLYVDYIFMFCICSTCNIHALTNLFTTYYLASCQIFNRAKSTIYSSSISMSRLDHLSLSVDFYKEFLPWNYLGVPLFKCRAKTIHLQPIIDKIILKLLAWKGSYLSMVSGLLWTRPDSCTHSSQQTTQLHAYKLKPLTMVIIPLQLPTSPWRTSHYSKPLKSRSTTLELPLLRKWYGSHLT